MSTRGVRLPFPAVLAALLTAAAVAFTLAPAAEATPAAAPTAPSGQHAVVPTDTPAGRRTQQVLGLMNSERPATAAETLTMADPRLTADLLPQTLLGALTQWQLSGPYRVTSARRGPDSEVLHLRTAREIPATLTVHVDPVGLIDGITLRPETPKIHNWRDVDAALANIGGRRALLAADTDGRTCTSVFADGADAALPLASTFKLYVLGALEDAIKAGTVHWDDNLTITAGVKSLPSGELQNRPDGSTVTVREAAEKMISISDNTAADLLIHRLGRARVEAAVRQMGDQHPQGLIPFPTTHELFVIGWAAPDLRARWRGADEQGRRRILTEADARPLDVDTQALLRTPVAGDGVGWFASATDLCRAHAALQAGATGAAAPIRGILAMNPGVHVDKSRVPYVAYKGGSTPGNLIGSWYVTDRSGRGHVVAFQLASERPIGVVESNYAFLVLQDALGKLVG